MTPHSGKRRRRGRFPMPFWIPLPRPCLRSLNVPGRYYIPVPPDMYLPWAYPPPHFMNPACRCAHEDFCSPNDCRNSAECLKIRPGFCPYGKKEDVGQNTQQNPNLEVDERHRHQGTSLYPKTGVCSACGGTWTMDVTNECQEDLSPSFKSDFRQQDDLYDSHEQNGVDHIEDINSPRKNTFAIERKATGPPESINNTAHKPNRFMDENNTSKFSLAERPHDSRSDSSSQTADRVPTGFRASTVQKSKYPSPKRAGRLSRQLPISYENDSERFPDKSTPPSSTMRKLSKPNRNAGCSNHFAESNIPDSANNPIARTLSNKHEVLARRPTQNLTSNKSHDKTCPQTNHLTEQVSTARKKQLNQSNSCCTSTESQTRRKRQIPDEREFRKSSSKSRSLSECGCSTKKFTTKKSFKGQNNDVSSHSSFIVPKCHCKFPPAYRHLSCNTDPINNCDCANMPLQ